MEIDRNNKDYLEIVDKLIKIIYDKTQVSEESIKLTDEFSSDLDIDSLSMLDITLSAEDVFDVSIPDTELRNLVMVQDAADYIYKHKYNKK